MKKRSKERGTPRQQCLDNIEKVILDVDKLMKMENKLDRERGI